MMEINKPKHITPFAVLRPKHIAPFAVLRPKHITPFAVLRPKHIAPFAVLRPKHIAPLAVLRIAFGLVLLISTIRFMAKGWVHEFYIAPRFLFPFYGFQWLRPLPAAGMYAVFIAMMAGALCITLGLFYRIASAVFFFCFVYVELLDKSYYLNHYYFVTLMSFLLLLVPAHRYFSLDVARKPALKLTRVPAWMIDMFRLQICLVYFFAGLSKLTPLNG